MSDGAQIEAASMPMGPAVARRRATATSVTDEHPPLSVAVVVAYRPGDG